MQIFIYLKQNIKGEKGTSSVRLTASSPGARVHAPPLAKSLTPQLGNPVFMGPSFLSEDTEAQRDPVGIRLGFRVPHSLTPITFPLTLGSPPVPFFEGLSSLIGNHNLCLMPLPLLMKVII